MKPIRTFWGSKKCFFKEIEFFLKGDTGVRVANITKLLMCQYFFFPGLSAEYEKIVVDNMLEHATKNFIMRELRVYHADKVIVPNFIYQEGQKVNNKDVRLLIC